MTTTRKLTARCMLALIALALICTLTLAACVLPTPTPTPMFPGDSATATYGADLFHAQLTAQP